MKQSDEEIVKRVLLGDDRAFEELLYRHKNRAMTLAMQMLKNFHDAEEALQDAFVRAYRALSTFEGTARFSTWLYRIVFNVCATKLNKRENVQFLSIENDDNSCFEIADDSQPFEKQFSEKEVEFAILKEVENLPLAYRTVATMFFVQELTYDEISEVTGLPLGTVKTHLFRARQRLKEALKKCIQIEESLKNF